ncbi:S8 family serine peptidase [Hugenholtzia roseola]|uniref:S8 family serine peptidase n=1 Tax=Hugenholtzia roseola TaxID=1002 RepID=UPI00068779FA|nr:S8 family serine peptidase [Hugenholtzia roseola]
MKKKQIAPPLSYFSKVSLLLSVSLFLSAWVSAQKTQLVLFKDKNGTPFNLQNPRAFLSQKAIDRRIKQQISLDERDLPVNPDYLRQIAATGAEILYPTKWQNGALVFATEEVFAQIQNLPFVLKIEQIAHQQRKRASFLEDYEKHQNRTGLASEGLDLSLPDLFQNPTLLSTSWQKVSRTLQDSATFGAANDQNKMVGIDKMHAAGYRGEGIWIAVFDGGFRQWVNMRVFAGMDIGETYDFVLRKPQVDDSSDHGSRVLSVLASNLEGQLVGGAPKAKYFLYKTEDVRGEMPIEEAYWLIAAERADSVGVDIIQSSLGYYDFDDPAFNYKHEDLDGRTALISRAADWAAERGILVVTSAGNEGNLAWRKITFPADARNVLAVGAVNVLNDLASFSSRGNAADGRIKPDLVTMGSGTATWGVRDMLSLGNGTSFAAPVLSGLAAGFWQANPTLKASEVREYLKQSGHQYRTPDENFGYGIPHFQRAQNRVVNGSPDFFATKTKMIETSFPNPLEKDNQLQVRFAPDFVATYSLLSPTVEIEICNILGQILDKQVISMENIAQNPNFVLQIPVHLTSQILYIRFQSAAYSQVLKVVKP